MPLTPTRLTELKRQAIHLRRLVVESVHHAGAGHLGGPMSAADMLVSLYFEVMDIDPQTPHKQTETALYYLKDTRLSASMRHWPCAATSP